MKNIIGLLILSLIVNTQAGKKMIIHSSGSNTEYIVAMVDSITFEELDSVLGKMKLIYAKDSSFIMGSEAGDEDEKPVHIVNFTYDFWMDSTEVTQKEYKDLMSDPTYGYENFIVPPWHDSVGLGDNYPAYKVNWHEAVLYCNALSKKNGLDTVYSYNGYSGNFTGLLRLSNIKVDYSKNGYRLPTESEWEYSCRATTTTDHYWGNATADDYAWYNNNGDSTSHEVSGKLPNKFGLYDMSGNVGEWCNNDTYGYTSEEKTNPKSIIFQENISVRSGGYLGPVSSITSYKRYTNASMISYNWIGFRVVRPAEIPDTWK